MAKDYEIIVYTASREKYADPLLDILDQDNVIRTRLYRESCVFFDGFYIKDLSRLNRDLSQTIIVDNSPNSYIFHPENAIDCTSFIDDPFDKELYCISSFLHEIAPVNDVRNSCIGWKQWKSNFNLSIADS
jgi:RNA polymerase II subunit A small phosphatase-like protein